eukprot:298056-Hanusia_phi.AAC.1
MLTSLVFCPSAESAVGELGGKKHPRTIAERNEGERPRSSEEEKSRGGVEERRRGGERRIRRGEKKKRRSGDERRIGEARKQEGKRRIRNSSKHGERLDLNVTTHPANNSITLSLGRFHELWNM